MWIGLTFVDDRAGKVLAGAREKGLLVNAIGDRRMRFAPSLLLSDQEIDKGADIFREAVKAAA
jgi:acetylornithine/succinyldiaminopimelate/putrescine aminotransferase